MSQEHDDALERLLGQVSLREPSADLDERMEMLLGARRRWMIGPALGFAAGVLVTVGVMRGASQARTQSPAAPRTQVAMQTLAPPAETQTTADVWGVPYQQVSQMDGEIDGVPVRIEQTQRQVDVWQSGRSGSQYVTSLDLPGVVTVSPIGTY